MSIKRVSIIQRVLAPYRQPFFDRLQIDTGFKVSVIAGQPMPSETLRTTTNLSQAQLTKTKNFYVNTPIGPLFWQLGIANWLRETNPDVIICEANPRLLSTYVAIRWMKERGRPCLGWGLGQLVRPSVYPISVLREAAMRKLISQFDKVVAYSSKAARDFELLGVSPSNVYVAPNSVDTDKCVSFRKELNKNPGWIAEWKLQQRLSSDKPIILYVGRLIPKKDPSLLIRACLPIIDLCSVLIVGDGPCREALEEMVPIGTQIRFLGHLEGESLAKCFMVADVFVLPAEGGLVAQEAMSYGKPVIASKADGSEDDYLRHGKTGLSFQAKNVADLQAKILELLRSKEQRQQMGRNAASLIDNELNLKVMVESFRAAIQSTSR